MLSYGDNRKFVMSMCLREVGIVGNQALRHPPRHPSRFAEDPLQPPTPPFVTPVVTPCGSRRTRDNPRGTLTVTFWFVFVPWFLREPRRMPWGLPRGLAWVLRKPRGVSRGVPRCLVA